MNSEASPCWCGSMCETVKGLCEGLSVLGDSTLEDVSSALEHLFEDIVKCDVLIGEMPVKRYCNSTAQVDMRTEYDDPILCGVYYIEYSDSNEDLRNARLCKLSDLVLAILFTHYSPNFINDVLPETDHASLLKQNECVRFMFSSVYEAIDSIML